MISGVISKKNEGKALMFMFVFTRIHHPLVHLFSSVAHVWVPGAKTTWRPIVEKFVFS
jgi:hypothetical protein